MSFKKILNKLINAINRINRSENKYYILIFATLGAVQLIYKYSWYVKPIAIIIVIMNFAYLYLKKKENEIKYSTDKCSNEENIKHIGFYSYLKIFLVWLSFFLLLINTIVANFDEFFLEEYGDLIYGIFLQADNKRSDILIIIILLLLVSLSMSVLLSNWCARQSLLYYFTMENVLYKKKYFRLNVWNTIMHKVNNGNGDDKNKNKAIYNSDITIENLSLINFDEHEIFKEKLKFVSTWQLEWILFYDQLPKFEDQIEKGIINPEGFGRYVLAGMTVMLPILIENSYTEVLSYLKNLSIPKLLFLSFELLVLTLIFWNIYKDLTFTDKRKQIDSFFYNDIKGELDSRNIS